MKIISNKAATNVPSFKQKLLIIPANAIANDVIMAIFLPLASESIFIVTRPKNEPKLKID